MTDQLSFRRITHDDTPFLTRLYGTTRQKELNHTDWTDAQKQAFIEQQFQAQHIYYHSQFPEAAFDIILVNNRPIGRRYIHRGREEIRLVDLSILPQFQGRGIGRGILKDLQAEASENRLPVRHHVEINNRQAFKLYQKLGFRVIEDKETHLLMEWSPALVKL